MKWLILYLFFFSNYSSSNQIHDLLYNYNDFRLDEQLQTDFSKIFLQNKSVESKKKNSDTQLSKETYLGNSLNIPPSIKIDSKSKVFYAEGTGTRDGGSGILSSITAQTKNSVILQVHLLDVYRSMNLDLFPTFFSPEEELLKISSSSRDKEDASNVIYKLVLQRIRKGFPILAESLDKAEKNMPKDKWIGILEDIPLIEDYIGDVYLQNHQRHLQIAFRLTNKIFYNEKLYSLMDGYNRAALKLHEYLYAIASQNTSIQIQRLVSLFMGLSFNDEADYILAAKELKSLSLEVLALPSLKLPKGVNETQKPPNSEHLCGQVKGVTISPQSISDTNPEKHSLQNIEKLTLSLEIYYYPNQTQFQRQDLYYQKKVLSEYSKSYLEGNESKIKILKEEIDLKWRDQKVIKFKTDDPEQVSKYIYSIIFGMSYLDNKFPNYLYPSKANPPSIICINNITSKIATLEISKSYNVNRNDREFKKAELEAEYFTTLREYVIKFGKSKNKIYFRNPEKKKTFVKDESTLSLGKTHKKNGSFLKENEEEEILFNKLNELRKQLYIWSDHTDLTGSLLNLQNALDEIELGGIKFDFEGN